MDGYRDWPSRSADDGRVSLELRGGLGDGGGRTDSGRVV